MEDVQKAIDRQKKQSQFKKIIYGTRKTIEIASSIASTILNVRDNPKLLDKASVGVTFLNMGINIYDELSKINTTDPRTFYSSGEYYKLPYTLERTVFKFVRKPETLISNGSIALKRAWLLNHEIFWIKTENNRESPYCKMSDKNKIVSSIGKMLWEHNGTTNVLLDKEGGLIPSDETLSFKVIETNSMQELEKRVINFMKKDEVRSYLLEGPPGTGKSSAAMYLIKKLNLKSLRTSLTSIYGGDWQQQANAAPNLDILLAALRPEMIIIDDIDRAHMGDQQMLKLFETARKHCKIIMATCNNKNSMIGAMLRVGRFDDHILFDYLDTEVVQKMLDEDDQDIAERLSRWPIAYIQNYKTVKRVMGRKQARFEIDDMEARILQIQRKTLREGPWQYHVPLPEEIEQNTAPKKKKKRKKRKKKKKNAKSKNSV